MFQTTNQAFSDVLSLSTATVKFLVGLRQHFLSLRWLAPCESRRVHQLRASCGCGLPHLDSSSASRTRTPSSPLSPTLPSLLLQLVSFHWSTRWLRKHCWYVMEPWMMVLQMCHVHTLTGSGLIVGEQLFGTSGPFCWIFFGHWGCIWAQ